MLGITSAFKYLAGMPAAGNVGFFEGKTSNLGAMEMCKPKNGGLKYGKKEAASS